MRQAVKQGQQHPLCQPQGAAQLSCAMSAAPEPHGARRGVQEEHSWCRSVCSPLPSPPPPGWQEGSKAIGKVKALHPIVSRWWHSKSDAAVLSLLLRKQAWRKDRAELCPWPYNLAYVTTSPQGLHEFVESLYGALHGSQIICPPEPNLLPLQPPCLTALH